MHHIGEAEAEGVKPRAIIEFLFIRSFDIFHITALDQITITSLAIQSRKNQDIQWHSLSANREFILYTL